MFEAQNDINLIKVGFSLMISSIILLGSLMNSFEKYLPVFIKQTFRYGKFAYHGPKSAFPVLEVPKSWFKHFYVFSSAYSSLALLVMLNVYLLGGSVPLGFEQLLDLVVGSSRKATVTGASSLLAMLLLALQSYRRLYETHFVSIFAKNSRMNFSHYVVGFSHYAGAVGAILVEAPAFAHVAYGKPVFRWTDLTTIDFIGTLIFIWAWYHQFRAAVILANLRKDVKGKIVTQDHKLPHGDWFEYVSSPHLLAEILMYTALTIILWGNTTWIFVLAWVATCQVETSLLSHWWYKENFKDFPKQRKAIIPFIY